MDADTGGATVVFGLTDPQQMAPQLRFRRASSAIMQTATGAELAGIDQPRYEFSSDGEPLGILIESANLNFVFAAVGSGVGLEGFPAGWDPQHENFVTSVGMPMASDAFPGFQEVHIQLTNMGNSQSWFQIMFNIDNVSGNTAYTHSWYHRIVTGDPDDVSNGRLMQSEWQNDWTPNGGAGGVNSPVPISSQWTRFEQRFTTDPATGILQIFYNQSIRGMATVTIAVVAPQIEEGNIASSPIASDSVIATRAGDVLELDLAALNTAQGTFVFDFFLDILDDTDSQVLVTLMQDGVTKHQLLRDGTTGKVQVSYIADSGTPVAFVSVPVQAGSLRVGFSNSPTGAVFAIQGQTSEGPALDSVFNVARIGSSASGQNALSGHVRRVRYWEYALTASELAAVTTPD